ncbi:MAG TPA: SgcJ/EcaC family oxidoreductase [Bryobacteraceae bacterium]|nr:SgcJ/EcaC family oxidoreductase [Bryobacteraceae bacterium]
MGSLLRTVLVFAAAIVTASGASDAESQIKAVLNLQVEAWNRGDIPTFMTTYAPDCVFVGKQVAHGRDQLLARYKKTYPTPKAMGHLTFNALEVHVVGSDVAFVTGEWHLARTAAGGNAVGGLFSLVLRRQGQEWKIALDHTS